MAPVQAATTPLSREDDEAPSRLVSRGLSGLEVDIVVVCGLELRILRRRRDFFAACAGDLPIKSTGLVLWECGPLLADYLGYARWKQSDHDATPWWQLHPPAPIVPSRFWPGHRVLELGCGCGLVAAVLASLGASVVATDCDEATLETAQLNAREAERRAFHARKAQQRRHHKTGNQDYEFGKVEFAPLTWGDADAAQSLARERGPFHYVVGSDLLYGDKSPPEPLVETLAALFSDPGFANAEVILALKNRCADETGAFCRVAQERGLWSILHADSDDLLEGYDGESAYGGDGPAYSVVRLVPHGRP